MGMEDTLAFNREVSTGNPNKAPQIFPQNTPA